MAAKITFEKLPYKGPKFNQIIHLADVHILLTKRHSEFKEIFEQLYQNVEKSDPASIVCVLGDLFHSKNDLSPECVDLASEFLNNLANLRPTILIAGNHDCTLSNKNRLDSLTPIVNALKNPSLYYLKHSKLYGIGNILFNNMSVFDSVENYIHGKDIPDVYRLKYERVVAMFHGPLDKSISCNGYELSNPSMPARFFDWHDIVLLGDIHKRQVIQNYSKNFHKPYILYPGSFIQQDHSEDLHGHGYVEWNLSDVSYNFRTLDNECGYVTIDIENGQLKTDISKLPPNSRLKVNCLQSIPSEVKEIISKIKDKTNILEASYIRVMPENMTAQAALSNALSKHIELNKLGDLVYQETLIKNYLDEVLQITDKDKIKKVIDINKLINSNLPAGDTQAVLKWKPIKFEWDNLFSYGEGNSIDFSQLDKVYGIFGENTKGKSSVFNSLCFCLFDKWPDGYKAVYARNYSKSTFWCKFEFEIDDIRYFIEKNGKTMKDGNVKVEIKFWKEENGNVTNLTEKVRQKTNEVIRKYVGTYEDFILTTLSLQTNDKNNISFIQMGNSERKDLLVKFIGLEIFDRLRDSASDEYKRIVNQLKPHANKNYQELSDTLKKEKEELEKQYKKCKENIVTLISQQKELNNNILEETSKKLKLEDGVPKEIDTIKEKKKIIESQKVKLDEEKEELNSKLLKFVNKISPIVNEIDSINLDELKETKTKLDENKRELSIVDQEFLLKKKEIEGKLEKLDKLSKHKYDPNCQYCVQNIFVKDAISTKKQLDKDYVIVESLKKKKAELDKKIKEYSWVEEINQKYVQLLSEHKLYNKEIEEINKRLEQIKSLISDYNIELQSIATLVDLYEKNQQSIIVNSQQDLIIEKIKSELNRVEDELSSENTNAQIYSGKVNAHTVQIENLGELIKSTIKLEEEKEVYGIYLSAMSRDGIPFQVICKAIPEVEDKINSLLSDLWSFSVRLQSDDKNIIPYIQYIDKGQWPIEMASNFEKFVLSIAFRFAFSSISNLPSSNFLVLDEGFGSMDDHNRSSVKMLFSLLKSHFDFLFIISHLDTLKDSVDEYVEISSDSGFSKMNFPLI